MPRAKDGRPFGLAWMEQLEPAAQEEAWRICACVVCVYMSASVIGEARRGKGRPRCVGSLVGVAGSPAFALLVGCPHLRMP